MKMYQLVRPRIAVPVHGELRHMLEHADLPRLPGAADGGRGKRRPDCLAPGRAEIIGQVPVGRLAVDGNRIVPINGACGDRSRAIYHGSAVVTVVLDKKGRATRSRSRPWAGSRRRGRARRGARNGRGNHRRLPAARRADDAAVKEAVRIAVRRVFRDRFDKRPVTSVHLVRA